MSRAHNFSAGPAVLPLSVIEQLAAALPDFHDSGLGLMELSHRSPTLTLCIGLLRHVSVESWEFLMTTRSSFSRGEPVFNS